MLCKRYLPFWRQRPACWRSTQNQFECQAGVLYGFDSVFELQCDCPCEVDLLLKFPPGVDKPVQVNGNISVPLAHAGCLRGSKRTILGWRGTNSVALKGGIQMCS